MNSSRTCRYNISSLPCSMLRRSWPLLRPLNLGRFTFTLLLQGFTNPRNTPPGPSTHAREHTFPWACSVMRNSAEPLPSPFSTPSWLLGCALAKDSLTRRAFICYTAHIFTMASCMIVSRSLLLRDCDLSQPLRLPTFRFKCTASIECKLVY